MFDHSIPKALATVLTIIAIFALLLFVVRSKEHDSIMEECTKHHLSKNKELTKWELRRICDKEVAAYLRSKSKN